MSTSVIALGEKANHSPLSSCLKTRGQYIEVSKGGFISRKPILSTSLNVLPVAKVCKTSFAIAAEPDSGGGFA